MQPLIDLVLRNPFEFFIALVTFVYMLRGKPGHAMYAMYLLAGLSVVARELGGSQMIAGVILGVFSNELFRIIRLMLNRENRSSDAGSE